MTITRPDSMDQCLYFTNRSIGDGQVTAWVYKKECPKCKKPTIAKPIKKDGKPDKKAPIYECPTCKYQEPNEEVEDSLRVEAHYTCPWCKKDGASDGEYKRKSYKGVKAYILLCEHCGEKIPVTKKLKEFKGL